MKVVLSILLVLACCSTLLFSRGVDSNAKKSLKCDPTLKMGIMKFTHGYGEFTTDDGVIERKRSHKRRRFVRKPRKGRGQ
jgi:hypothetical protein